MASITKTRNGYRAQIYMRLSGHDKPVRDSKSFRTKREAAEWAANRERELREEAETDPRLQYTLRKALRKYADEVSPTKRGERWEQVHERHCHLPQTKTGRPRDVPLSSKARALFARMRGWDDELVFGLKAGTLDALFRKYRARAGLEGFTWHDTRHTAATMISRKVGVLDLCKIFGWADPKMAMVYFNPHAETLADLLD